MAEATVPVLGPELMRKYETPPATLFRRLRLGAHALAGAAEQGVTVEGDLLTVRRLQWAGVFALGSWLAFRKR